MDKFTGVCFFIMGVGLLFLTNFLFVIGITRTDTLFNLIPTIIATIVELVVIEKID